LSSTPYGHETLREVSFGCMASKVAGFHHRIVKKTNPERKTAHKFWRVTND